MMLFTRGKMQNPLKMKQKIPKRRMTKHKTPTSLQFIDTSFVVPETGIKRKTQQPHQPLRFQPSCDPGGTRTHDPLIKSQLLYQLSYGVIARFNCGAKVLLFFKPPTILTVFFIKKAIFWLIGPKRLYLWSKKPS